MKKKWLFYLILCTVIFLITSFFVPPARAFAFRWMTLGMSAVSLIFYSLTVMNPPNKISGNLLAIGLKFILSSVVFILYYILFRSGNRLDYFFFIIAYVPYSIICYTGAYLYSKSLSGNKV